MSSISRPTVNNKSGIPVNDVNPVMIKLKNNLGFRIKMLKSLVCELQYMDFSNIDVRYPYTRFMKDCDLIGEYINCIFVAIHNNCDKESPVDFNNYDIVKEFLKSPKLKNSDLSLDITNCQKCVYDKLIKLTVLAPSDLDESLTREMAITVGCRLQRLFFAILSKLEGSRFSNSLKSDASVNNQIIEDIVIPLIRNIWNEVLPFYITPLAETVVKYNTNTQLSKEDISKLIPSIDDTDIYQKQVDGDLEDTDNSPNNGDIYVKFVDGSLYD